MHFDANRNIYKESGFYSVLPAGTEVGRLFIRQEEGGG